MFKVERDMREIVTLWLAGQEYLCAYEAFMLYGASDIVAGRFAERVSRRRPALIEGAAVELKMHYAQEVLRQGMRNRNQVDWSYAAMPAERIAKMRETTLQRFRDEGVGLLAVSREVVEIVIAPVRAGSTSERVTRNLWRRCKKSYDERATVNMYSANTLSQLAAVPTSERHHRS